MTRDRRAPAPTPPAARSPARRPRGRWPPCSCVLLLGVVFNADGAFFKLGTHRDMLRQASVFGILACGMTLVIITGGIDLAVGSVLGLSAVVLLALRHPLGLVALAGRAGSACWSAPLCGLAFGRRSSPGSGIQPFIATLAMMVFARGLAKCVSGGMKISTAVQNPDGTYRYVDVPAHLPRPSTRGSSAATSPWSR